MNIRNSVIWDEVEKVFSSGSKDVHFKYTCEILADGEKIEPLKLDYIKVIRQYSEQFSDYIYIDLLLGAGTFASKIYPHRSDLKITLFKEPLHEIAESNPELKPIWSRTYTASLLNTKSDKLEGKSNKSSNPDELDDEVQKNYTFQLIDMAAEILEMTTICTIVRDDTTSNAIDGLLTYECSNLNLDKNSTILGIDIIEGDNTEVRDHIIIPDGTIVSSLPDYIQNNCGGVYSTGMGQYIQNGYWYIFPQYNIGRFSETTKTLTMFNIPEKELPSVERTYRLDKDKLIVLLTGQTIQVDNTEKLQLTDGNGVKYLRAGSPIERFVKVDGDEVSIDRDDNIVEYIVENRKSKLNNVRFSSNRVTSNHQNEMSKLSTRLGQVLVVNWQQSNPDLIYPGMPCKYIYADGSNISELYGTVLGLEFDVTLQGNGINSVRHDCNASLYIFVERDV